MVIGFGVAQIPYFQRGTAKSDAVVKQEAPAQPAEVVLTADQIATLPADGFVFGEATAPITVVEFSDFQCSFCAKFFKNVLPLIDENYIKTGKVKLVYRDFPLDIHPEAYNAALVGKCAKEQGKFKEMHDALFGKQQEWSASTTAQTVFKQYAKDAGMDAKQFSECVSTQKYAAEVRKDFVDGAAVGVNGTPAFFVNGKLVSGALPYDKFFKPIFDAELAGKKWTIIKDSYGNPINLTIE
jgi:protein-disulfide isomerase